MIAILQAIGFAVMRGLPWLLKAAPFLISVLSFTKVGQGWFMAGAARVADVVLPAMGLPGLPSLDGSVLAGINYFFPLDTTFFILTAYIPFFLLCMNQRVMRALIWHK